VQAFGATPKTRRRSYGGEHLVKGVGREEGVISKKIPVSLERSRSGGLGEVRGELQSTSDRRRSSGEQRLVGLPRLDSPVRRSSTAPRKSGEEKEMKRGGACLKVS